jgi:enoyl-CoA hydratase/carnithine racemase
MSATHDAQLAVEVAEREHGILVTLTGGEAGNYLGREELTMLDEALTRAEAADKRWFAITNTGQDFCLGRMPGPSGPEQRDMLISFVQRVQAAQITTVAAADGGCVGFGVGVFALADLSIVTDRSWFQFPEIHGGMAPAIVASWLYDYVPYKQALRWTLTGDRFSAEEAFTFGLATEVVSPQGLSDRLEATLANLESIDASALGNARTMGRTMNVLPSHPAVRKDVALKWFLKS